MIGFEWLNHCMRDFTALIPLNSRQNGENTSKYVVMPIQGHGGGVPDHFTASGPLPMASAQEKGTEKSFPPPEISKWYFPGPC